MITNILLCDDIADAGIWACYTIPSPEKTEDLAFSNA